MTTATQDLESRLDEVIAGYLRAMEAGETMDLDSWAKEHPELADELGEFFVDHQHVNDLAQRMRLESAEQSALEREHVTYLGDYELLGEIARGGMGIVYRARQVSVNRSVALKVILAGQLATQDDVRRFHNEAELAANLDHPNIVPLYEVGEHRGQHFFSMKLVSGGSLSTRGGESADRPYDIAKLMMKITNAVQYAHERGLLHRDLKPSNVLLDCDAEPFVTDFGLAKRFVIDDEKQAPPDLTHSGAIVGTPAYASPEQLRGEKTLTTSTDIYGLGAILYFLLTGRPPLADRGTADLLRDVQRIEPASPRVINPKTPKDLETICLKCLEKDRARRYPSAEALARDLERFQNHEPIEARAITSPERLWRWGKRNPALACSLLVWLFVVIAGITASSWLAFESQELASREHDARVQAEEAQDQAEEARKEEKKRADAEARARKELEAQKRATEKALAEAQKARAEAERAKDKAESLVYAFRIDAARQALDRGDDGYDVREKLALADTKFHGWEYDYLLHKTVKRFEEEGKPSKRVFEGAGPWVREVAFTPDNRRLVMSAGKVVIVWDFVNNKTVELEGIDPVVTCVAASPDGKKIAAGGYNAQLFIWDTVSGKQELTYEGHATHVRSICFSPDGKRIVSTEYPPISVVRPPSKIKVWRVDTGKTLATLDGHRHYVTSAVYSPDGKLIASGSFDKTVKLWDAKTGNEIRTIKGHKSNVLGVAFSPDSQHLVSASADSTLAVWTVATGEEFLRLKGHTAPVFSVTCSPDGKRIISGSFDKTVKLWEAETGAELFTLGKLVGHVRTVAISPDGKRIAAGKSIHTRDKSKPVSKSTVTLWDSLVGEETQTLRGHSNNVTSVAISPDGKRIVSGSDDWTVRVWNTRTGEVQYAFKEHTGKVKAVAFSPDGKRIASGGYSSNVCVWDADTGKVVAKLETDNKKSLYEGSVSSLAFSPNGKQIVTGNLDFRVLLCDATTGKLTSTLGRHSHNVLCVAFSPDGTKVASGGHYLDKSFQVWSVKQPGRPLFRIGGRNTGKYDINCVAFSPDSKFVAIGWGAGAKIRDATTGAEEYTFEGQKGAAMSIAYFPDGKRIVTGCSAGTLKIWDVASGKATHTFEGHTDWVTSVAVSADGKQIVSGSNDRTVKLWNVPVD